MPYVLQRNDGTIDWCEAEVSKGCNICRKFGKVSIFTLLDEVQFIYNNYNGVQRNNGIRWKVMQNYKLEKLLTLLH